MMDPTITALVPKIVTALGVTPILSSARQNGVINLTTAGFKCELSIGTS